MAQADEREVLDQVKNFPCPVCGGDSWRTLGDLGNLLVSLPATTAWEESVVGPNREWGGLTAYPLVCGRCGFVRLHAERILTELGDHLPDESA